MIDSTRGRHWQYGVLATRKESARGSFARHPRDSKIFIASKNNSSSYVACHYYANSTEDVSKQQEIMLLKRTRRKW
jgi:hypothetical protein